MPSKEYMLAWRESKGPCSIDGCDRPYSARGLCHPHYKRLLRYGDPLGKAAPRPKRVAANKSPRVRKYRICDEHQRYTAGCRKCQAERRLYARDYMRSAENREKVNARKRGRDRSNETPRSPASRERGKAKTRAKYAMTDPVNAGKPLTAYEVDLIQSGASSLGVALMIGRSVQSIQHFRSRMAADPGYVPRGTVGRGPRWTPREDAVLLALSNKEAAVLLGRTYEAVKCRRSYLGRTS